MMNRLWVMRHGDAVWQSGKDSLRPLSELGFQQIEMVAAQIGHLLDSSVALWCSPYVRTKQTAEHLMKTLDWKPQTFQEEKMLTPDSSVDMLTGYLETSSTDLLLVSHMPIVAYLVQALSRDNHLKGFSTSQVTLLEKTQNEWCIAHEWKPKC